MNRIIWFLINLSFLAVSACTSNQADDRKIKSGFWRGELSIQGQRMPFQFEISSDSMYLINGEERLNAGVPVYEKDSFVIPMHIFDAILTGKSEGGRINGYWKKNYVEDYIIPFSAEIDQTHRFSIKPASPLYNIDGRWEALFLSENDTNRIVGVFQQNLNKLSGTFLTNSGDYRFLSGEVDGDSLRLSTFDGEHAYLFKALITDENSINGHFWSGRSFNQPWKATRNNNASLPDPHSLNFLKPGYEKVDFSFPGLDAKTISPSDEKYRGKVLILQVFGTWCPNCMDETRFFSEWYRKNRDRGVEILGLAFERKDDFAYASDRVAKMKDRLGVDYDFVIAGKAGAGATSEALPMISGSIPYPTTIFIDRAGKVRRIHPGFNGPGTGIEYEKYIGEFNAFMSELLNEPAP